MKMLKKGDVCPCCGQVIKTNDPNVLRLLSWVAEYGRLPRLSEIVELLGGAGEKENKPC